MKANAKCMSCLLEIQENKIDALKDEDKKRRFMHDCVKVLYEKGMESNVAVLNMELEQLYLQYYGDFHNYYNLKSKYNQYMLKKEEQIKDEIRRSDDPLKASIYFCCAGNYIDFGVHGKIDDSILEKLLKKAKEEVINENEINSFKRELSHAKSLVYITDNCGEIVMDKILIEIIKQLYQGIHITIMVRGEDIINDATIVDAKEVGLDKKAAIVDNGLPIGGISLENLPEQSKSLLDEADIIISKGMGNFESLYGEGYQPYYMFLCKCDLFVKRFGLKMYEAVFAREDRININNNLFVEELELTHKL